jgi:hypothetical protein
MALSSTLLTFNVGNILMQWDLSWPPKPVCPYYKLCRTETLQQVKSYIHIHKPDVVHFQEIWNPSDVEYKNNQMHQILPHNYKFACGRGAHELYSICTAWKSEFQLKGKGCLSVFRPHGGYLVCELEKEKSSWKFINIHGSALEPDDRKLLLEHLWRYLANEKQLTMVGGDFNSDLLEKDEMSKIPAQFKKISGGISTTSLGEAIDHIFVNDNTDRFKFLKSEEKAWPYSRWTLDQGWGIMVDHNPLWLDFN